MTAIKRVVLGSASPWRRKVLEGAEIPFTVMSPDIDEKKIRFPYAEDLTRNIATAKAAALVGKIKEPSLLITSDQVVVHYPMLDARPWEYEIREKPVDKEQAKLWLQTADQGSTDTVTAVVVTDTATRVSRCAIDVITVNFQEIPGWAIDRAIARGDVLKSCGAFTYEDPDIGKYVLSGMVGMDEREFRSSVDGLPLGKTVALLESFGWRRAA